MKRDVTRREVIYQKIINQFEFEEREQLEQEANLIINSMVFAEKVTDGRLSRLYYLIHWKDKTYAKNTSEPVKEISHLWQLLKKCHTKNLNKPTATSLPVNKGAATSLMAACLGAEIAFLTPALIHSCIRKHFHTRKNSLVQFSHNKQH